MEHPFLTSRAHSRNNAALCKSAVLDALISRINQSITISLPVRLRLIGLTLRRCLAVQGTLETTFMMRGVTRTAMAQRSIRSMATALENYANENIPRSEKAFGEFMYHAELLRKGHLNIHRQDAKTLPAKYQAIVRELWQR